MKSIPILLVAGGESSLEDDSTVKEHERWSGSISNRDSTSDLSSSSSDQHRLKGARLREVTLKILCVPTYKWDSKIYFFDTTINFKSNHVFYFIFQCCLTSKVFCIKSELTLSSWLCKIYRISYKMILEKLYRTEEISYTICAFWIIFCLLHFWLFSQNVLSFHL